jgi:hypothetical protein
MASSLDPDAIEVSPDIQSPEFGPSDTSDSASDVVGTGMEASDSDSRGTGERASVDSPAPSETDEDISPDKVEKGPQGDDAMRVLADDVEDEDDE